MKKLYSMVAVFFCLMPTRSILAQAPAPLKLVQKYAMPGNITGHFDHMAIDLHQGRLFATAEASNAVLVFDVGSGKIVHVIEGIAVPHAPLYRNDDHRLYVTYGGDGKAGGVKVLDGRTYNLIQDIKLFPYADGMAYDPETKIMYVDNGGGDSHQKYALIGVIDTNSTKEIKEFKVPGNRLKRIAFESSSARIYVNDRTRHIIDVIDRKSGAVLATWPVTMGMNNVPIALDELHHRLFVGCRNGVIVVFDTRSGKELQLLPIGKTIDDLFFDAARKRLYASCGGGGGEVDVYRERSPNRYRLIDKVPSGPGGKTALLAPSLNKYFVAVPASGGIPAEIYVYDVQ